MTPGEASAQGAMLKMYPKILMAHTFDADEGIAYIEAGWADAYPGGGNPVHLLSGKVEDLTDGWLVVPEGEGMPAIITVHDGPEQPDGTREQARANVGKLYAIR